MKNDKKLENIITKLRGLVFLTKEEKNEGLYNIKAFIKENPIKLDHKNHRVISATFTSLFLNNRHILKYTSIASVVLIAIGLSGVSLAANSSLPGDIFYPFKIGVNERVLGFVQFSDEAKAQYNANLAELRLQEFEKIVVDEKVNESVKKKFNELLDEHIEKIQDSSLNIKAKKGIGLSAQIDSELEASLNAHKKILDKLSLNENSGSTKEIKSFIPSVEDKIKSIKKYRENNEGDLSKETSEKMKKVAEDKLHLAKIKVEEVGKFVEKKEDDISKDAFNNAKENLKNAEELISQGSGELESKNYDKAFASFQKSIRISQETQISIARSISLKVDLSFDIRIGGDNKDNEDNED